LRRIAYNAAIRMETAMALAKRTSFDGAGTVSVVPLAHRPWADRRNAHLAANGQAVPAPAGVLADLP
jgi:hypothetical protein